MSARHDLPAVGFAGQPLTWTEFQAEMLALDAAAPGRYVLRDAFWAMRTIAEELRSAAHYKPGADERWIVIGHTVYQTTTSALANWSEANRSTPAGADRRYTIVEPAPVAEVIQFPAPAPDGFIKSNHVAGLWKKVDKEALTVTLRFGRAEATYCIRTGKELDASDQGFFPREVIEYIAGWMRKMPPPHKREEAAQAATRTASENHAPQQGPEPSVRPEVVHVNQKEDPMLDWSNPQAVAKASATSLRINASYNIPEIEARRKEVRARFGDADRAYRRAEVDVEQAKRRLSEMKSAVKDRGDELILVATDLKAEGTKPKYSSASALQTAVKSALKTDAAYTGILTEIKAAEASLKQAANDDKPAIETLVSQKKEALAAREAAINEALAAETIAESAPRYTSAESRNAAAIGMRKTDAEYLALKAEVGKAEQALYEAEQAYADAKSAQRTLLLEWEDLGKATDLVVARINQFGGLDTPPPITSPAPVNTPAAPAAVA